MNELRKDPILNRWVAILKDSKAPEHYINEYTENISPDSASDNECLLCPGNQHEAYTEIFTIKEDCESSNNHDWHTKVISMIKPVLQIEGELGRKGVGMYDKMNSIGANELIIESPYHNTQPEDLGISHMIKVISTYRHRISQLESDPRLRYTLIHKDYGKAAGEQYKHPHSHVIATPVIPKGIKEELDGAKAYYQYKERCIFCDIVNEELRTGARVIMETKNFVAFVPFAPKSPFEYWILPRRHNCAFQEISDEELEDFSFILMETIKKMGAALKNPPYNYVLHTAPNRIPRKNYWHTLGEDFHWHMEIMPQIAIKTGFEMDSEFYILTTKPEDAANYLKGA